MLLPKKKLWPLLIVIGAIVMGCKTQLAPEYDRAIVKTVTTVSEQSMRFFSSVSKGTTPDTYPVREATYDVLIGTYDALRIKAKARPIPKHVATKKINALLGSRGTALSGDYPSAFAFEQISKTFQKMKEKDKASGIKPTAMDAFKGQVQIFLDQALTYESFLKR